MTTLALQSVDNFYEGLAMPTVGREAGKVALSVWNELSRLRSSSAVSSAAFHDLATLAHERGTVINQSALFTMAQRFLLVLPSDVPTPELDVDSDNDVLFDWYGSNSKMLTVALRKDGQLSFAARLSPSKSRNGNDVFFEAVPQEIIRLARTVCC